MNSVVKIKLHVDEEQREALIRTMRLFAKVSNRVSQLAFEKGKLKNKTRLQKAVYHQIKEEIPESASQMIVRAISRVATSYQVSVPAQALADKRRREKSLKPIEHGPNWFRPTSSVEYDLRLMTFLPNGKISLYTPEGRVLVDYSVPPCFRERLAAGRPKMGKLVMLPGGKLWIHLSVEETFQEPKVPSGFLGVDQGMVFLASDSLGNRYEGATLKKKTERYKERRDSLWNSIQQKKTRSKERAWNRLSRKESGYRSDVNHRISKDIVDKAKSLNLCIVLENLQDFFDKAKVRSKDRYHRRSWAFAQLLGYIQYKALRAGIEVRLVNPAYTSQECSVCGNIDSKSRRSQSDYVCVKCGHSSNADLNAALVIRHRGMCQLSYSSAALAA